MQPIIVTGFRDLSYILVHSLLFRIIPIIIIIIISSSSGSSSSIRKNNSRTGRYSAVEIYTLGLSVVFIYLSLDTFKKNRKRMFFA